MLLTRLDAVFTGGVPPSSSKFPSSTLPVAGLLKNASRSSSTETVGCLGDGVGKSPPSLSEEEEEQPLLSELLSDSAPPDWPGVRYEAYPTKSARLAPPVSPSRLPVAGSDESSSNN